MGAIDVQETPCAKCTHYKPNQAMPMFGTCLNPDGPVKVQGSSWGLRGYPKGCPVDPAPPPPPRQRPKKKRLGRTPRANADEWKNGTDG